MVRVGRVIVVPYGRAATDALAAAVDRARSASALAPVTVVVASNLVGLSGRRLLGAGQSAQPEGGRGIANVAFLTPFRFAELVATDRLLDRRPLTDTVLAAAVRAVLACHDGPFAASAGHHATTAALADLYGELADLTPGELDAVDAEARAGHAPMTAAAVALQREVAARLAGFHDEAAVATAAAERPDLDAALRPFGQLVWYLPGPVSAPLARFLAAAWRVAPVEVIVGLTGDADADRAVAAVLTTTGVGAPPRVRPSPATATLVVSATDPEEEVREVVRRVVALVAEGVPPQRIGVFHPTPTPYARLLEQRLDVAGVPANGPSPRRLADSVTGRTLLAALDLPGRRFRRDAVLGLVGDAPVRHEGALAQGNLWEQLSRAAGVVAGVDDWRTKLARRQRRLADEGVSRAEEPGSPTQRRREAEREALASLGRFVDRLAAAVDGVERAATWAAKCDAAGALLVLLLGPEGRRGHWPEHEQRAAGLVVDALARLRPLDQLEPGPSPQVFARALRAELDRPAGRSGRFGIGVLHGSLVSAVGVDLDAVFVLGCAEGLLPAPVREDGLLPERVRAAAAGALPLRGARVHDQHRAFLAALAAAPPDRRVLSFPRGDLRSSRRRLPSRWLLESVSAIAGRPVDATRFDEPDVPGVVHLASAVAARRGAAVAADVEERDLVVLAAALADGVELHTHPTAVLVRAGLLTAAARRSRAFTAWDGNLGAVAGGATVLTDRPQSPSRLETWATCGFSYFLGYLLGLDERDDPERIIALGALDRGSAVHEVLETFGREILVRGAPEPGEPWSTTDRARLREIGTEVLDRLEAEGRTGRPVTWRLVRAELFAVLDDFLSDDDVHRAQHGATLERVELPFGLDDVEPALVVLADGRELRFRGRADRVDRGLDGRLHVIDYKTGKGTKYRGLDRDDPVRAGTTLQLGVYAEAARQLVGGGAVLTQYWMVDRPDGERHRGYPWDEVRRDRFRDVVSTIVDGIAGGTFPAVPGQWSSFRNTNENCTFCSFDSVCPRDRGDQAERKLAAPELRRRDGLQIEDRT